MGQIAAWNQPDEITQLWYYETDQIAPNYKTLVVSMSHSNRAAKYRTLEFELEKVLRKTNHAGSPDQMMTDPDKTSMCAREL